MLKFEINNGTDFAQEDKLSSEVSDASPAATWAGSSPYQYGDDRQSTIFDSPVGSVTR